MNVTWDLPGISQGSTWHPYRPTRIDQGSHEGTPLKLCSTNIYWSTHGLAILLLELLPSHFCDECKLYICLCPNITLELHTSPSPSHINPRVDKYPELLTRVWTVADAVPLLYTYLVVSIKCQCTSWVVRPSIHLSVHPWEISRHYFENALEDFYQVCHADVSLLTLGSFSNSNFNKEIHILQASSWELWVKIWHADADFGHALCRSNGLSFFVFLILVHCCVKIEQ